MTSAQDLVYLALRDGRLLRGECEIGVDCKGRIEGHHEDYSRPLEVRWLCQRHHQLRHSEMRRLGLSARYRSEAS